ncbi:MAG: hypothetical protein AB1Z23_07910 [Eubacteriales bacterium]
MKAKIKRNKNDNTMICDYYKTDKPFEFRYKILKEIVGNYSNVVMFIDTNSRVRVPELRMEAYFDENNIEYSMFKIPRIEKKIFGFALNIVRKPKTKLIERYIIAKIDKDIFTEKFYADYITNYDLALGINPKLSINEMVSEYREDVSELFFNSEYFEEFLYDSIMFASMRTTIDIANIVMENDG